MHQGSGFRFANVGSLCDPTSQCWLSDPLRRIAPADKKAGHYVR